MKSILIFFCLLFIQSGWSQRTTELEINRKDCLLKGTLTCAEDTSSVQDLVLIIAGSGPTDRNGNNANMKNNSLKMLSDQLVENGYATFRYDKRGIAASKLPMTFDQRDLSFDDFIDDASAWVDLLAKNKKVDKIILAGHSQGSLVALCVANKNQNVDAVISVAGAGRPIHQVLKKQLAATLSIEMQGLVNSKLDTLAMGDTLKDSPKMLHSLMHPSIQPFLISWMKYDPAKEIAQLKQPVLLVNGTFDIQVDVSEMELLAAANENATAKKIGKMNHVLKWINTKDMGYQLEQYSDPDVPLHKKLMKPIVKFISSL
ncbi:MAG: alpha/beta fold hydrolase [Crocinitomicaceae bacterium]